MGGEPKQRDELPFVSIVVVAHAASAHVARCLDSLRAQHYPQPRREFLLVHSDCEPTRRAMQAWAEENGSGEQIRLLDNPQRSLAAGWNVALGAAHGEILVRLDAHSTADPDFLRLNAELIQGGERICGGQRVSVRPDGWIATLCWLAERSLMGAGQAAYRRRGAAGYVDTLAHAAYHKSVFEAVGGYDERLQRNQDNEIHWRMRRAGYRFRYDPRIVSYHLARPTWTGLLRQKFLNGYWASLIIPIAPGAFRPRHFIPAAFVCGLAVGAGLALSGRPAVLVVIVGSYAFTATAFAATEALRSSDIQSRVLTALLPPTFLGMHLANGAGVLAGVAAIPKRYRAWRLKRPASEG